ncbi:hypothetical protein HPB51_023381 [Rhipicephalus microplus]|nr:hypothetical protein HPB51_023381 [Rhipicephalus microplus]
MKEAVDRSTGESLQELGTIPNSPGETRQVGVRQEDNLPDNTMDLSATGPEAPPRPNDDAMKQERRHSKGKQLEEGWLARDSALYVADTASQVATRLATIANNFLGKRGGPRRRDKKGPKRKQENDTGTTGHGSPGGLTPTALDVCGQGSEGHPARPQTQHPVLLRHPQPGTTKHPQEPTDPQKTEHWAKVSPVGLLFPETRSNDVIPQAVLPQQPPPWKGNIPPRYLTQPMGALPIGLDLARMIADMVQHYMRQQHPQ